MINPRYPKHSACMVSMSKGLLMGGMGDMQGMLSERDLEKKSLPDSSGHGLWRLSCPIIGMGRGREGGEVRCTTIITQYFVILMKLLIISVSQKDIFIKILNLLIVCHLVYTVYTIKLSLSCI